MGVAALICMVLLIDHAGAQLLTTSRENYSPAQGGPRYSNHSLDCGDGRLVLIVDVEIVFRGSPCCTGLSCSFVPSAASLQRYVVACGNSSRCRLSIEDPQRCGETTASPQLARVSYLCSSASAVLAMDRPGSVSGRTVAARFSSPDLQSSNSSWQCRVEASDCSNLNSSVELLIRNTQQQLSSFFSTSDVERLGKLGLESTQTTSVTPFSVDLHLVNGSLVQPAYVTVTAGINISMTCGIANTASPATFCNQCASSPCQEGFDCVNEPGNFSCEDNCASSPCPEGFDCVNLPGNFSCVDKDECSEAPSRCDVTERCNNTEGSFHCYCRHGYSRANHSDRCLDIDECATNPRLCNGTAGCKNTQGSFHCYCDPGFILTDNNTACAVAPPKNAAVGLAVAGGVAGLMVIAGIVAITCACSK